METAMFGAGCFWGVESAFGKLPGVIDTEVGYAGGHFSEPSYEAVCSGVTGHAEVVRLRYDPDRISYAELLEVFWAIHDPTQLNRQGPDTGSQYRSAIFCYSDEQYEEAVDSKSHLGHMAKFEGPIATEIHRVSNFYRAEDCHQHYLAKRGQDVCRN